MRTDFCKHYNGLGLFRREPCGAGVDVREMVGGDDCGWIKRTPCQLNNDASFECEHRVFPTAAEVEAKEAEWDRAISRALEARTAIIDAGAKPGTSGSIDCPACGEELNWSMAGNSHVHARCKSDNCVAFME